MDIVRKADVVGIKFADSLPAFKTDIIEIDLGAGIARLTNKAGKVKAYTKFTVVGLPVELADGSSTTAGA